MTTAVDPAGQLGARKTANQRLLLEDIAERRVLFRGLPEIVSLHTTDVCNLRCVMCPRSLIPGTLRVDRDVLARVCEDLFPTASKAIFSPAHGEPLVSDFDVVLDAALRHGVVLDVVTNGTLLTPELYREAQGGLNHVNVSLDSHVPAVYERIRRGARFSTVLENLRAIRAERERDPDGVVWTASAVVMRSNLEHLPEFVAFAADVGMDGVVLQPLRQAAIAIPEEDPLPRGRAEGRGAAKSGCPHPVSDDSPQWRRVLDVFDEATRVATAVGINLYLSDFCIPPVESAPLVSKVGWTTESKSACWYMTRNLSFMPGGEVYPCCHPTDHRLGTVPQQRAGDIWNGLPMQRMRHAHFSGRGTAFCNGCLHAPYLPPRKPGLVRELGRHGRLWWDFRRNARRRALITRGLDAPTRRPRP